MTAKQMFKELGYDMYEVGFAGKETHFVNEFETIIFLNEEEQYEVIPNNGFTRVIMDVETQKAIIQYMKERGW
jgi:hypothetical protein